MYTKIKENLYLVSEDFSSKRKTVRERVNHILILDASGSMAWAMDRLVQDVIKQISNFDRNDTISVGWFSSKGQFGWVVKGMSVSEESAITSTLKNHHWAFNMTCFSDILSDTQQLIKDLKPLSDNFSLMFFSDGQVNQEAHTVKNILTKLAPNLGTSMFIGYGDYYGREQMYDMATTAGGTFVHSSTLNEFSSNFAKFRESSGSVEPKVELKGDFKDREFMLALTDKGEVMSFDMESKSFYVPAGTKKIVYLSSKSNKTKTEADKMLPEIYAMARTVLQSGMYGLALDILGTVGDVNFIDKVNNSFTVQEYGTVENTLLDAINNEKLRFSSGKKANYLPKVDAFCMLELLDLLTNDENVKFLPYHPSFEYKRIGRTAKQKTGYPKFEASKSVAVPMNTLVWNSKKLNIGVLARIPGTIDLDSKAHELGLDQLFNTYIWRNYSIISDGKLNVTKLPLTDVSEDLAKVLYENDLVESSNGTFVIDLARIPIINRKIADSHTDLNLVCALLMEEKTLESDNKVFASLFKKLPSDLQDQIEVLVKPVLLTDDQVEFLSVFGIKRDGSFSPETEKAETTDVLQVKEFEFGIEKLNTLPKLEDVLDKKESGKSLTPVQQLIKDSFDKYSKTPLNSDISKALWLKESLNKNRVDLRRIRAEINRAKFAVVLGKTNFKQLPVLKEVNSYTYNGNVYTIKISNVEVPI